jgi:PAS domain S-box-containing protein
VQEQDSNSHPANQTGVNGGTLHAPPAFVDSWGAEELAATLDSVGTGIWALDLEGRCVFINQAACRTLGYPREECLGQKIQCRIHAGHGDGWVCPQQNCRVQSALQSGSAVQVDDDRFQRRDGTPIAVKYSIQPVVLEGRIRGFAISMVDITARKRAEEGQRKSDEWLGFAQTTAGVGIFDLDLNADQARVSEGQFRLFGLDPAGKWPSHEEWRNLVHPEDRERMDRQHELALSGLQPPEAEYRVVWPDGSIHWLFSRRTEFFDEAGRPARVVGVNVDVTGRVRAEMALNQFFSASPTPMAIVGFDGRFQRVNPAWEPILEFTAEEAEGTPVFNWIHPEDRAAVMAEFEKLIVTGKRLGFECRARRKDGSYRWILLNAGALKDAQVVYATVHDMTGHRRAEEALLESEAKFRALFDCAPMAYHELDMDGVVRRVNRAECALLGYEAGEMLGRPVWEFVVEAEREASRESLRLRLSGEQTLEPYQRRYLRRDGGRVWVEIHDSLVRNAAGETTGIRAALLDITERRRTEINRHMREEVLSILGERGPLRDSIERVLAAVKAGTGFDGVGIRLQDGDDFSYFSQDGFPQDFLLTENTLIERGADGGVCRDCNGNARLECACGLVLSGKTDPTNPLFTRGGSYWTNDSFQLLDLPSDRDPRYHPRNRCVHLGYASIALVPIRMNDRIVGLLQLNSRRKGCFSLPVIEQLEGIAAHVGAALMRQQAEQALRESEAKFRELFDGAPVAYHELDMDGVVRRVNRAECALLGYQAEEMLGRPVWEFVAGVDREASREAIRRKLSAEQPLEPVQRRYARRDGGELWVEIHDILVRNAAAQTTGIRSALLDITERKRLAEDLERHVEKLARSNGDLERFAYVASHDLQEPLRMVASFTQLLAKRYSGRLDETADRYIYFAVDGARRMQQLIVDLLEYSRVNSKELDLRRTECEAVVQTALQNLSGAVITRDPLPVLTADAAQLGQLFQNLIGNAIKFRGKAPLRIHIAATDNGPDWLFSVQDNGIGIDPRHSARIFQIFQRLHTREQYPGTGIGLAVCQKVVERHGGKIWVESEPGAGSTFRFTIPKSGKSE